MTEHSCLHEEQILGQSRAIERLGAELEFKKERLDEIKENNRRMEEKIDKLGDKFDKFINKSDTKDTELDNRLIKIETRQEEQEKATKKNRDDFKLWLAILAIVFSAITLIKGFIGG